MKLLFSLLIFLMSAIAAADCRNPGANSGKSGDLKCLACNCYHEAKGEIEKNGKRINGHYAVLEVVMNRVASRDFPNKICSVVYEKGQFQWAVSPPHRDSKVKTGVPKGHECWKAAEFAYAGNLPKIVGNKIAFANVDLFNSKLKNDSWWKKICRIRQVVGDHIFCTDGRKIRSGSSGAGGMQ